MQANIPTYEEVLQLPLTHETAISDEWIDVMGHMNVAYYTASFSSAMQNVRSSLGMTNRQVKEHQIGSFAIETHTRYVAELRVGEHIQIHSRVLDRAPSQKRLHAMHFMVNADKQLVSATFEAIVANVDLRARRMAPILPEILQRLDALIAQHRRLEWAPHVCGVLSC